MPSISSFYGITIFMFLRGKEHNPPHVHAITENDMVSVLIETGEVFEGDLPPKARAIVKEFVLTNQNALMEMWETGKYGKLPPVR